MKNITLSICIPTYNFGAFIADTLDSIFIQDVKGVEVVILDGASTDNTHEVIERFQKGHPHLIYHRRDKKGGIDRDLATSVELAHGKYCWLLSSDDVLQPGSIHRMLKEIESEHDVYLCNRTECDLNLKPIKDRRWLSKAVGDTSFNLSDKTDLLRYFHLAMSVGALFSYISSMAVCRQKWLQTKTPSALMTCHYAHVYKTFKMIEHHCKLRYIADSLVFCRGDNDSFLSEGRAHRCLIDLDGYQLLAGHLFSEDEVVQDAFLNVMRREYRWFNLLGISYRTKDDETWNTLKNSFKRYGYSSCILYGIRIFCSCSMLISIGYFFKRALRRSRIYFYKN